MQKCHFYLPLGTKIGRNNDDFVPLAVTDTREEFGVFPILNISPPFSDNLEPGMRHPLLRSANDCVLLS